LRRRSGSGAIGAAVLAWMNAGSVTRLGGAGVQSCAKCNRKGIPGQLRTFARGNLYVGVWEVVAEYLFVGEH